MPRKTQNSKLLRLSELLYLFLMALAFYLLFLSRTGEARTVWEVLNPAFTIILFLGASLLVMILLTSEKATYKLLFIIIHSILIHSFFSIIFPAGDLSGQQMVLGRTRLIYDNAVLHGWPPWPVESLPARIYQFFRGENFQAGLSTVVARMLSIDLLWVHLWLVPFLWGVFTPLAAYLSARALAVSEKVSILAAVMISAFPFMTYFGAISVPISIGFILFFYALYFMMRYINEDEANPRITFLMLAFSFMSFLAHYLAGVMSLSLLLLALLFKSKRIETKESPTSKATTLITLIASSSLLPLALINLRLFRPETQIAFTLEKLFELPLSEILGLFAFGELIYGFDPLAIVFYVVGPAIALSVMIYLMFRTRRNADRRFRVQLCFLFAAFLIILVDYRILKLMMTGLPLNEERLWVFRDFIAALFVALAVATVASHLSASLKTMDLTGSVAAKSRRLFKRGFLSTLSLALALNVLMPVLIGGWTTSSLRGAYPTLAPLQTTWYELEAVRYIDDTTHERYVVIGDVWTIFAGERIVGLNNPRAYYFMEFDKTGFDLFSNMTKDPSPQPMILAMAYNNASVAYFIVTEPRLGTDEFRTTILEAQQVGLRVYASFANGRLYIFYYRR